MEIRALEKLHGISRPCVVTIGMYDGVHIGHQRMLQELVDMADRENAFSVVVTFLSHPRNVIDNQSNDPIRLLQTTDERFDKIAQFDVNLLVVANFTKELSALSPKQFLDMLSEKLNITILLLGYDNRFGNPNNNEYEELLAVGHYKGIKICKDKSGVYFNGTEVSSTQIRKAIVNGEMQKAASMLAAPYSITSQVEKGLQNGTKLGFPTANIYVPREKILPKCGVYATNTIIDGVKHLSVTNIGNNPTFDARKITVETYIMDFNDNIYGKCVTVEFIDFLREEKKFADVNDLRLQMQKDTENARKILA